MATDPCTARPGGDITGPPGDGLDGPRRDGLDGPRRDRLTGRAADRRRQVVVAGHRAAAATARAGLADEDPGVRSAALGALLRAGALGRDELVGAMDDPSATVRRRACDVAGRWSGDGVADVLVGLRGACDDPDPLVVERACWALGEHRDLPGVPTLVGVAGGHPDARCREAAVAALGAVGHPDGLAAVLGRLADRPAVRRRAAVALAAFDAPAADDALRRCLEDRDWQVREVAEVLLEVSPDRRR